MNRIMLGIARSALELSCWEHTQMAKLLSRMPSLQTRNGKRHLHRCCRNAHKTGLYQSRRFLSNVPRSQPLYTVAVETSQESTVKAVTASGVNLRVTWADDRISDYPFIYLRDNCQCSQCLQASSQQRIFDVLAQNVSVDLSPSKIKVNR